MKTFISLLVKNKVCVTFVNSGLLEEVCFCCNKEVISINNFQCGYIQSESQGGETKNYNLRPICGYCNKTIGY
jgi:hypothetical protein